MNWCVWIFQHLLAQLLFKAACSFEFEIAVPRVPLIATYGQQVILDCSFPVDNTWKLDKTVITWQRGLEVVHSFYYGGDQLNLQSGHFVNRTSLFHSVIKQGNASLLLERTNMGDAGDYTCSVSSLQGSQKKTFPLKLAALFDEPRLNLKASPSGLELLLSSHGGYPHPSVQWLDDSSGEDVTNDTNTRFTQDSHGLYMVSSNLTLQGGVSRNLTFILLNKDLGQKIRREFTLYSDMDAESPENHHDRQRWCFIGTVCLVIFAIATAFVLQKTGFHKRLKTNKYQEKTLIKDNGNC